MFEKRMSVVIHLLSFEENKFGDNRHVFASKCFFRNQSATSVKTGFEIKVLVPTDRMDRGIISRFREANTN